PERERLKQLGLELLGNRDDIPLLLAASDVVVVPSRSEGLGLAAIEALAAGRPVVASAVGGLPEVVDPQVGVLVESENPEAIAREVRRLIEDPELRERLGAAGRAKALSHFDLETMRAATLRAYRRAVKCE
ncbi:MAG: glycosyltransferase, partial [Armatimonadota bacterium]